MELSLSPKKSEAEVKRKDPNVGVAEGAHGWLVVIGIVLVAVFVALLVYNRVEGSETKETSVPTTQAAGSTTTAAEPVTKTTEAKSVPSDTVLSALLGAGAGLILVGFLFTRISSIKLPGGTEIGMGNLTEKEKKDTADKVAQALPADASNQEVAEATIVATNKVAQVKAVRQVEAAAVTELPPAVIEDAVAQVTPS